MSRRQWARLVAAGVASGCLPGASQAAWDKEVVRVHEDHQRFCLQPSGRSFRPMGFNYDHDAKGNLLEDYWHRRWEEVVEDLYEMKELGANTVRIHLQLGRFLPEPERPDQRNLRRLEMLLEVARQAGLYLDITGLGCYHKQDVPPWYDAMEEADRWRTQQRFWREIARRCASSPVVFCYDLMNEPVVPGQRGATQWLGPGFAGKHFVQFITRDLAGRPRHEVARQWVRRLVEAIREADPQHLITVGLVPWSTEGPGLTSGFIPRIIAPELDFLCIHIYPESDQVGEAVERVRAFLVGKPLLVEETFPLKCSQEQWEEFFRQADPLVAGWIGFYWGQTPQELQKVNTIPAAITRRWLQWFKNHNRSGQP